MEEELGSGREAGCTGRDLSIEAVPEEGPAWPVEGGSLPFSVPKEQGRWEVTDRTRRLPSRTLTGSSLSIEPNPATPPPTFAAPPFSGSSGTERGFTPRVSAGPLRSVVWTGAWHRAVQTQL